MQNNLRGIIEMTSAMIISGTIGLMVILSGRPVAEVVFWRCLFGTLTLLPVCWMLGYLKRGQISKQQLIWAILGGIAIVLNWLFLFASYAYTSISIATTIYNVQPFMLVSLGAIFLNERLTKGKIAWLLLSFCGVLLIILAKQDNPGHDSHYLAGILFALTAAFFYAIAAFIAKKLKGLSPFPIALIQLVVGTLMLLPIAFEKSNAMSTTSWGILITIGMIHTGLMYILLYSAIQRLQTHLIGALSFIYPVIAFIVDAIAFGHRFQLIQIAGALLIFMAATGMMMQWGTGDKPRALSPAPVKKQSS